MWPMDGRHLVAGELVRGAASRAGGLLTEGEPGCRCVHNEVGDGNSVSDRIERQSRGPHPCLHVRITWGGLETGPGPP